MNTKITKQAADTLPKPTPWNMRGEIKTTENIKKTKNTKKSTKTNINTTGWSAHFIYTFDYMFIKKTNK